VSTLSTSTTAAAQVALTNKLYNAARRLISDGSAKMIYKAAEALQKPLNTKSMEELVKATEGVVNIEPEYRAFMEAAAREQAEKGDIGAPKALFYGTGKLLSTKGSTAPIKIPLHRIASIDDWMKIAEADGVARSDTAAMDAKLIDMGYKAVQHGADKVRLLK
jgi:NAD(P)H-dependent FMN reductase